MRWKRTTWPDPAPRPETAKLDRNEATPVLDALNTSLENSPVMKALGHQARFARGRFYIEHIPNARNEGDVIARITPLAEPVNEWLFERGNSKTGWKTINQDHLPAIIKALTIDGAHTFYGLGLLDESLRRDVKYATASDFIIRKGETRFFTPNEQEASVQEVLYHYFHIPITVIAEPREWYAYHRSPGFLEISADDTSLLVQFAATSMNGEHFAGVCLYIKKNNEWTAYRIKPNQSHSIESAVEWLEKRVWVGW